MSGYIAEEYRWAIFTHLGEKVKPDGQDDDRPDTYRGDFSYEKDAVNAKDRLNWPLEQAGIPEGYLHQVRRRKVSVIYHDWESPEVG